VSEPTSYSERNIDQEVELRRLQELLRTGGAAEPVEDTSKQTIAAGSSNSSVNLSSSSATATEVEDPHPSSHSGKTTAVSSQQRGVLGSTVLKERRTYFMQNGCNRSTEENSEQKRRSVDVSQGETFQEPVGSTAATCTASESTATPVLANPSRPPGDVTLSVPSSRAVKMQRAVEQQMQLLADDLQRTFNAATALSPVNTASDKRQQPTSSVHQLELSAASDTATRSAADSQSVTSDYSTMSSVCGGQDHTRRRKRLVSADLDVPTAPDVDVEKITADKSAVDRRRNRNEVAQSTPRSQSSGNFSLTNSDGPVEASPYTASGMELSQDSIDSAADRSDQLSLSLSSQMSGSQISDTDDLLRTAGIADTKQSYSPVVVYPSGAVDQTSCMIDSSGVTSADTQVEQFVEPTVAYSNLHDSNIINADSETNRVSDKPSCDVDSALYDEKDFSRLQVGNSAAESLSVDTELAGREQKTDCRDSSNVCQVRSSTDADNLAICSKKIQFLQSHRLVRRHTLGGTGDLAIHVVDRKLESPVSVQSAASHDEERLSAWQRLKPVVGDQQLQLPNFGVWLAMQREVYHVRSSPALLVGIGLSTASRLHSSQLNCQPVV